MDKKLRALAIYLPQFHPFKENDEWWGKGFTEWRNVVKGKELVKGQYQPHLPADLGFYDLRVPEIREQQAELARQNNIYGFCYYHYWFNGKRMMERPVNEVLASSTPDFPFALCWANENWSRNWDGRNKDVLAEQKYSLEDDIAHIQYLCKEVFPDKRYIKVDGKPLFMVYRPSLFPDMRKTIEVWRKEVKKFGFDDLYLGFYWSFDFGRRPDEYGFDFAALFPPNAMPIKVQRSLAEKALSKLNINVTVKQRFQIHEYEDLVNYNLAMEYPDDYVLYPAVTPMWDNYVRRRKGNGRIYINSTPELYQKWLSEISEKFQPRNPEENFIFINAWNEWAEGNHLEPCEKWGHQYLTATKNALQRFV